MGEKKVYIAIDLKSFYASVECHERGLDPMTTNLLVADPTRTEKTVCLAVSPSLKTYGISGRARLFEAVRQVRAANAERRKHAPGHVFTGKSCNHLALQADPSLEIDYIVAPPRMAHYMEYSTWIYQVYLKHVAPEDIHVYSIDEVFIDATPYLRSKGVTGYEFARMLIRDVLETTGITATAGIGTNLYLCKIAMDVVAKHTAADEDGVRIAELDEASYRRQLWGHTPITDFWRVGHGYEEALRQVGIYTMGDIAKCSLGNANDFYNESLLYKLFGINAELLIDHAWGREPCTIADIKAYRPDANSISSGQVLQHPYDFTKARLIVREMTDLLVLDLVDQGLVTDQIVLTVGYDIENLSSADARSRYQGEVSTDRYGRKIPKHAHGTANLGAHTSSTRRILDATMELYDRIMDKKLSVRRINVTAAHVIRESEIREQPTVCEQISMFDDLEVQNAQEERQEDAIAEEKEKRIQKALLEIKKKYGKNAILKGMNLEEGATAKDRNRQIGGHKA